MGFMATGLGALAEEPARTHDSGLGIGIIATLLVAIWLIRRLKA